MTSNTTLRRRRHSIGRGLLASTLVGLLGAELAFGLRASGAEVDPEARKVLKGLAGRVDHPPDSPVSGAGEAVAVEDRNGEKKDSLIEFRFKGDSSRSDVFDHAGGRKGARRVVYAENRENSAVYNGYNAMIQASRTNEFYRTPHLDFHPETFARILGNPLSTWLTGAAESESASTLSLNLDPNGVLHIEGGGGEDPVKEWMSISLDTTKGYRLVAWEMRVENGDGPGSTERTTYTAAWQKFGPTWYVKETSLHNVTTRIEKPGAKPKIYRYDGKMVVNNFVPNVPLEDSEFTLAGFKLPPGTRVYDEITGAEYRYGSAVPGPESSEKPAHRAEPAKVINSRSDANAIRATMSDRDRNRGGLLAKGESPAYRSIARICLLLVATICIGTALLLSIVRRHAKSKGGLS